MEIVHDNKNLDKINDNVTKKLTFGIECGSFWEQKNNRPQNTVTKVMIHWSNTNYPEVYYEGKWKKYIEKISFRKTEKYVLAEN